MLKLAIVGPRPLFLRGLALLFVGHLMKGPSRVVDSSMFASLPTTT
jgi:hypothetical protein